MAKKDDSNIVANKSFAFALRIVKAYTYLTEHNEFIMSKQLLRSGTSIGANCREAKNAQSRLDFINKLNIALKEADETAYWLELLHEADFVDPKSFDSIYNDCTELIKLLTSIVKTSKETTN